MYYHFTWFLSHSSTTDLIFDLGDILQQWVIITLNNEMTGNIHSLSLSFNNFDTVFHQTPDFFLMLDQNGRGIDSPPFSFLLPLYFCTMSSFVNHWSLILSWDSFNHFDAVFDQTPDSFWDGTTEGFILLNFPSFFSLVWQLQFFHQLHITRRILPQRFVTIYQFAIIVT